ncbi:hypothetical protein NDU88_002861 [Pleurodeles waltl]|uniref:Uncharacterized protein n=1 Tax=Pleurodeles waltl TaxID=8319 RepID=A0AAV7RGS3_PLEWA|nr:hypothetical protein NDU88_002861 [Pleurodeles waltl]
MARGIDAVRSAQVQWHAPCNLHQEVFKSGYMAPVHHEFTANKKSVAVAVQKDRLSWAEIKVTSQACLPLPVAYYCEPGPFSSRMHETGRELPRRLARMALAVIVVM